MNVLSVFILITFLEHVLRVFYNVLGKLHTSLVGFDSCEPYIFWCYNK